MNLDYFVTFPGIPSTRTLFPRGTFPVFSVVAGVALQRDSLDLPSGKPFVRPVNLMIAAMPRSNQLALAASRGHLLGSVRVSAIDFSSRQEVLTLTIDEAVALTVSTGAAQFGGATSLTMDLKGSRLTVRSTILLSNGTLGASVSRSFTF
jgi:hypothetical protein